MERLSRGSFKKCCREPTKVNNIQRSRTLFMREISVKSAHITSTVSRMCEVNERVLNKMGQSLVNNLALFIHRLLNNLKCFQRH